MIGRGRVGRGGGQDGRGFPTLLVSGGEPGRAWSGRRHRRTSPLLWALAMADPSSADQQAAWRPPTSSNRS